MILELIETHSINVLYRLWAFVTSSYFEFTVFGAILINTISLAMSFYHQPQVYTDFLDVMNLIFTVFFAMEFVIKLAAYRPKVIQSNLSKTLSLSAAKMIFLGILYRPLEFIRLCDSDRVIPGHCDEQP